MHFDLVNDRFKWLIEIVHGVHAGRVILQVYGGDLVVITLEASNHLKETQITVGNLFGVDCARVDVIYAYEDMELQGLVKVAVHPKEDVLRV